MATAIYHDLPLITSSKIVKPILSPTFYHITSPPNSQLLPSSKPKHTTSVVVKSMTLLTPNRFNGFISTLNKWMNPFQFIITPLIPRLKSRLQPIKPIATPHL